MNAIGWIILFILIIAVIVALAAWFYQRATNEVALVRTGAGGRRVMIDGGVLAVPYFHEISRVNMQTLRLDVARTGESALITRDRLRVDVGAEFYVSVSPNEESITRAAQTLGNRTFKREELRGLIDGMMVDALRSVAARMSMDELHENRSEFVAEVRTALTDTLARYGLQLDSVSLTALDQTAFAALDENNAFNAVGMRKLAEVIAKSKKERAEIDAESEVSVRRASMEASRKRLEIELEERRAQIAQQQEIETLTSAQIAEVARRKADSEREAAAARIAMEQSIQAAEIARERDIAIAEQERQIALAAKSQEESRAQAEAEEARGQAVTAAEHVETARATAEANRRALMSQIAAEAEARATASRQSIAAENERTIASNRAAATVEQAEAEKSAGIARAEANRARIESENSRSPELVAMELEKAKLEAMPKIVAEMVKPAEKINAININQMSGVGQGVTGGEGGGGEKPALNQALDSMMSMAVQLPVLKKIGDQMGVTFDDVDGSSSEGDGERS